MQLKERTSATERDNESETDFRGHLLSMLADVVVNKIALGTVILLIIGVLLLLIAYALALPKTFVFVTDLAREIGTGVLVTGVVSGLIQILIIRSYNKFVDQNNRFLRDNVTQNLKTVSNNIENQTDALVQKVASLEAMSLLGISRIYFKRQDARLDIEHDVQDPAISQIYLIGVSLNDFIGGKDRYFNQIWTIIDEYVEGTRPLPKAKTSSGERSLDIKVLIVDPHCHGAHLRSYGENRQPGASSSRLYADVGGTINDLRALQSNAKQKSAQTGVTLEFRLYRLPPQLFLLSTDKVSYIEPYYFWASRAADASMPLLQCGDAQNAQLHRGMHDHFNLIWEHASVSADQFYEMHNLGVDEGLHLAGVVNVFHDHREARPRLLWLLKNARQRVYILGISLQSYFDGHELNAAIKDLVGDGKVDVKILLLNPASQQAHYRSYREYLLNNPPLAFEEYQKRPELHQGSDLYRDTRKTIEQIQGMKTCEKFQLKLYDSAPTNFMLLIDDYVLVEQYHYGDLRAPKSKLVSNILGEDTVLFEYTREQSKLYATQTRVRMFELMESHFEFVFNDCAKEYQPDSHTSR